MEQTGTLRKRKRRILTKVTGLSVIPYETNNDHFTGRSLFTVPEKYFSANTVYTQFSVTTKSDTRLQLCSSAILKYRKEAFISKSKKDRLEHSMVTQKLGLKCETTVDIELNKNGIYSELKTSLPKTEACDETAQNKTNQREYFLDNHIMNRLQHIVFLGIATGALPWKWNKKTCRVEKWEPRFEKLWWYVWIVGTLQHIGLAVFQLKTFLRVIRLVKSYRVMFRLTIFTLRAFYSLGLKLFLFYYGDLIRQYINSLLLFNKVYTKKYIIHLDDFKDGGRLVINGAILTSFSTVGLSTCLYFSIAERPWYLFSFISPKPWYWRLPGAFHEFLFTGQMVVSYTLMAWMIVAHSNSVKFWLSETHNKNNSDHTTDALRSPKTAMETFKSIQVLQKLFNECMSPMGIPVFKITISISMIPTGYILFKSLNHIFIDEMPGILYHPVGVFNCIVFVFAIINMAAEVYDISCSFLDSWSLTKQKDLRRMLMSFSGLKLWVGRYYFMTISTTMTFLKFIFDYITYCILTFT